MPETISQQDLERYFWGAAVLLRGYIDASDYKQFIFPLLYYKRICDVYDEETVELTEEYGQGVGESFGEYHRFIIPKGSHWKDVRERTSDVGVAIQSAMREIEKANPDRLGGIFGDAQWTNKSRLSDETLRDLIENFSSQTLSLAHVPQDELGQGYEYLIKKFADDSGHTAAEFYTNRTLVKLMTLCSTRKRASRFMILPVEQVECCLSLHSSLRNKVRSIEVFISMARISTLSHPRLPG